MAGPDAKAELIPQRVLAGRYHLVRLIAVGGMAEVWEGRDAVLARPVAVKVLMAHLAARPGFNERFRREAVAAARLVHPHIVATFDAGTTAEGGHDELGFIVMELISGPTLRQLLEGSHRLPPRLAVAIAVQAADALDHAHRSGVVHRD
ncbi:MAG TPA: protein kinase, partial [Acidimicrobiales bacterium]